MSKEDETKKLTRRALADRAIGLAVGAGLLGLLGYKGYEMFVKPRLGQQGPPQNLPTPGPTPTRRILRRS